MELIITLAFVAMIALLLLTTWQHRIIARQDKMIVQQRETIAELEARHAVRTQDALEFGRKLFRLQNTGREREAALGRE